MDDGQTDDGSSVTAQNAAPATLVLLRRRAFIILGLSGLAITQPILGLFGDNPQFFVAGSYTTTQIVAFGLLVALVPPLVGIAITAVGTLADRRVGAVAFAVVISVLALAFALALARTLGVDGMLAASALAVLLAAGIVLAVWRSHAAQLFFSYLAVANAAFIVVFLFVSPASELVIGDSSAVEFGQVTVPELKAPLVVVVLDELPAGTIMRSDGSINSARYPGFARLAQTSTWFRNASSTDNETLHAVPTILTGKRVELGTLPTYADHPRNLFTMLGRHVPVDRFEAVTNMCPPQICEPAPPRPLSQAFTDASIVYGHRVLPDELRDELPAIDNSWGDFGGDDQTTVSAALLLTGRR